MLVLIDAMRGRKNLYLLCICNNRQQHKRYTSNTHTLNKFSTISSSHLLLTMDNVIRLLYLLLQSWIAIVMAIENCWRADGSSCNIGVTIQQNNISQNQSLSTTRQPPSLKLSSNVIVFFYKTPVIPKYLSPIDVLHKIFLKRYL